ncbi:MAG: alpha/beta fold hydrolase [Rhodococcus sp. (in: high G+C Gram-positive bacteria)]
MSAPIHEPPPDLIAIDEFFADPQFSAPSISPDGNGLAYLAPNNGRRNVWVRDIRGGHVDALCVTHDARRGISAFQWTDDSRWLLYLQDTDGNEDWHLYRVDLDNPDLPSVDLTPMPAGSRVFGFEPLPSSPGSVLVWMNQRPTFIDVFRIVVASGETTLHREQTGQTDNVLLDRNGNAAFHTLQTEDGTVEISAVDDVSGDLRLLRRIDGSEHPLGIYPQIVTPDGEGLLIGSYQDSDHLRLVRIDRRTGEETVVCAVDGHSLDTSDLQAPGVLPPTVFTSRRTGEVIAARFNGDKPSIAIVNSHFAEIYAQLCTLSDGVLGALSSDDAEERWVATFVHDVDPAVTWFYDHTTGESREFLRPYPHLDPAALAPMTAIDFRARDGLPLHGYLTLPIGVEPRNLPLILMVHGGPWAHDTWGFSPEAQMLANRGYAVLQVNFRGSTGYGKQHITCAVGEFAGAMHEDLIDATDWAIEQGYADPARLGIFGGSYGGYAALLGITLTPDLFAAAVDYVGISDLANFMRTLPPFVRTRATNNWYRYVGDPADPVQEADMLARSPITMVDKIRTPLLVAQGANDARVVKAESDNIVESLRDRGIAVEYLLAENEGHGFSNPENQLRMYFAVERHFARHLGGRSGASGSS